MKWKQLLSRKVPLIFFLDYGCRLTLKPISIQPIFTIYTVEPYIIRHDSRTIFFYLSGDASA